MNEKEKAAVEAIATILDKNMSGWCPDNMDKIDCDYDCSSCWGRQLLRLLAVKEYFEEARE